MIINLSFSFLGDIKNICQLQGKYISYERKKFPIMLSKL